MYNQIFTKEASIAVIGLGYVGLPIALAFAKLTRVIGFDVNDKRVEVLRKGIDPGGELHAEAFENVDILFTSDPQDIAPARFFIVAVPTPVDAHNVPDLSHLLSASETLGKVLKKGDYVVVESTVYPGCTEEDCIPVMEKHSGLKATSDFKVGYSPERINPGDREHTFSTVIKVVSGCDEDSALEIARVYGAVVKAGIHIASSIKVAEAAKVIENTQRDVNIALMNELSIIFDRMNISTSEVLEAAKTKWNFLQFYPGLVGGHCIGVDPYYLTYKAAELGFNSRVILSGRYINDNMGNYVSKKIIQHVIAHSENVKEAKILIMGIAFKENVSDIRNSKVADVVKTLQAYYLKVFIYDPLVEEEHLLAEHGLTLIKQLDNDYDAVMISVAHNAFACFDDSYFASITRPGALIADLKSTYRNKITSRKYWSL